MTEELERFKAAFGILHNHISAQIALGHLCGGAKSEAGNVLQLAVDTIHPPPEFEEVEVVRWAIFRNDDVRDFFDTEESAIRCRDNHHHGAPIIKLTGTIKRPVKREVVKEVSVEGVQLNEAGSIDYWPGMHGTALFNQHRECHGKTVTLIARWTE